MTSNDARAQVAAPEIEHVLDEYRRLVQMLSGARPAELLLESNVTMAQMKVLMLLSTHPEQSMSELATALHVSLSTVSGLVDRLVDSRLVGRRTDDHDRRQVIVSLSPEGNAFLDRFQELGISHLRTLLNHVPPADLAAVRHAVEVLINAAAALPKEEHPS